MKSMAKIKFLFIHRENKLVREYPKMLIIHILQEILGLGFDWYRMWNWIWGQYTIKEMWNNVDHKSIPYTEHQENGKQGWNIMEKGYYLDTFFILWPIYYKQFSFYGESITWSLINLEWRIFSYKSLFFVMRWRHFLGDTCWSMSFKNEWAKRL